MSSAKREIVLDRYWLLDALLAGGMASVYKARDLEKDELVAIKRFDRDKLLPELEAEAFRREVEALRNLIHPNILKIRDAGEDANGRPFLVLEWMSHDLVEHRRRGSTAFNGWDDFADQVAIPLVEALAHAHANGYCHRDVKPANVLVADDGTVKLADFGISKLKRCLQRMLKKQYRMVPAMGRLISECFYDGEVESDVRAPDPRLTSVPGRAVTWVTTRYLDDRREERAEGSYVTRRKSIESSTSSPSSRRL